MTISDDWFEKNIKEYALLLKKQDELLEKLSVIHDELINLTLVMTNEEINEAKELFENMTKKEEEIEENIW